MGLEKVGKITDDTKKKVAFKLTLDDLPFTTFNHVFFFSKKWLKKLEAGEVNSVDLVMVTGDQRNLSCEVHKS